MLADARARGLAVSADVAAHQLWLTEDALAGFNAEAHLIPPLRTRADRDALRAAVAAGDITVICSDHQPHEPDAKLNPFPQTEPGMSALETLLPVVEAAFGHGKGRDGHLPGAPAPTLDAGPGEKGEDGARVNCSRR